MRRLWIVRFVWLLLLAAAGTAVLPMAHDLSHRHGWRVLPATVASAESASAAADGEANPDAEADICLVCAHLASQHIDLPGEPPAPARFSAAPASLRPSQGPSVLLEVAWLTPAPRAPPLPTLL